jgi:NAD(P)-dependent dehydrogenase (short-subunit alcohol dehydrogenase family)
MSKKLEGKVALVTGGSSGIGRATALAYAREGAKVVVASRGTGGLEETVELIHTAGGEAVALQTDVTREAEVEQLVERAVAHYGRLDCAFNNAGIPGSVRPFFEYTEAEWDQIHDTNLKGVWLCMKHETRQMLRQGGGSIVNTSSMAGLIGSRGIGGYAASKHGVLGLTKTAALELATSGVRVNAVCPGTIHRTAMIDQLFAGQPELARTVAAMHPMARVGEPTEVAEAVVWLSSDAASFVTGHALPVDGGLFAGR